MISLLLAAGMAWTGAACAQDELDAAIEQLAGTLATDETSAKLAALAKTLAGKQAIKERIEFLLAAKTGRIERDSIGAYEDYLFKADDKGFLQARPERAGDLARLTRDVAGAPREMEGFNKRADSMVARIAQAAEMDQRARSYWSRADFRVAIFHQRYGDLRERDGEQLVAELITKGLEPAAGGKLRLGGPYRQEVVDHVKECRDQLGGVKTCEKSWLKLVLEEKNEIVRTQASDERTMTFILGRLIRQAWDGADQPIGTLADVENSEDKTVTLNVDIGVLVAEAKRAQAFGSRLDAHFDRLAADLAGGGAEESDLADLLKNPRTRMLLLERVLVLKHAEADRAEKTFQEIREDGFEASGDLIWVKKGRYADEQGKDSLEVFENECKGILESFRDLRWAWDLLAERLADPALVRLFETGPATFVMQDHRSQVVEALMAAERKKGLQVFTQLYLEKKGDVYAVLPRRAARIAELAKRAEEIRKEDEKAAGQNGDK